MSKPFHAKRVKVSRLKECRISDGGLARNVRQFNIGRVADDDIKAAGVEDAEELDKPMKGLMRALPVSELLGVWQLPEVTLGEKAIALLSGVPEFLEELAFKLRRVFAVELAANEDLICRRGVLGGFEHFAHLFLQQQVRLADGLQLGAGC